MAATSSNQKKGEDHEPTWHARSVAGKAEDLSLSEYQPLKQTGAAPTAPVLV